MNQMTKCNKKIVYFGVTRPKRFMINAANPIRFMGCIGVFQLIVLVLCSAIAFVKFVSSSRLYPSRNRSKKSPHLSEINLILFAWHKLVEIYKREVTLLVTNV